MRPAGRAWIVAGLAAALAVSRGPLHRITHALPVSNDDAIPLLIAKQILRGELTTILWNQPYNGTLDAYLLAPGLLIAPAHLTFRLYQVLCGLLLVALIALVSRRCFGAAAAGWAAALAAVGTPYVALMAATGPTPNFLVPLLVTAAVLTAAGWRGAGWLAREAAEAQATRGGADARCWAWAAGGLVSGLAIWDSAVALPALAGAGLGLAAAGLRVRRAELVAYVGLLLLGAAPLAVARAVGASGASPITAVRPRWLWADGLTDLGRAAAGLFGLEVPLVIDGPERVPLPLPLAWALGAALTVLVVCGARRRAALPLLGWGLGLAAAFAASRRTGADEIRYLYGLVVPVFALCGSGLARAWAWHPAVALVAGAALVGPWAWGHRELCRHWADPLHAVRVWQVPPLEPALATLSRAGVGSAYASLQFAARLSLESGGRVISSQAWNERIPGDPLRFRDEVDLDPKAAWVLSPHLSRGMPRAPGFRDLLRELGGSSHEDVPGDLVVFRSFRPPYDEARPVPREALAARTVDGEPLGPAALDREIGSAWISPTGLSRGSGLAVRLTPPRRVSALVLVVDLERSPLAVPWIAELDGEPVARGPARHGLQWVNGAPRAGKQALLAVLLGDRRAGEVRLLFQGSGPPLSLTELFVYGPDEREQPMQGAASAAAALERARSGDWDAAVRLYAEAARLEPERASHHAALSRARWRAQRRRWLDVESLDDGGPDLVTAR